ncbi:HU family DNA-binding protein [Salmonella enterica]|nr:HU family DNA-binding protein [Salmonella enterica]EAO0118561.1 HU family DNA-binding protein [Salmonella enterica]EAO3601665.1 HU family DNA-binding protein [Salmonella enterica]EAR6391559.1 HU family DNA-binding protein [Salmonella enterica]EAV1285323.1 HU family DNA-binding protein [Salmonella enterica]
MTKLDLIIALSTKHGFTRDKATEILSDITEYLITDLETNGEAKIHGVGTLKLAESSPRSGRNPKTGEVIHIPSANVLKFKTTKTLKERLNP